MVYWPYEFTKVMDLTKTNSSPLEKGGWKPIRLQFWPTFRGDSCFRDGFTRFSQKKHDMNQKFRYSCGSCRIPNHWGFPSEAMENQTNELGDWTSVEEKFVDFGGILPWFLEHKECKSNWKIAWRTTYPLPWKKRNPPICFWKKTSFKVHVLPAGAAKERPFGKLLQLLHPLKFSRKKW